MDIKSRNALVTQHIGLVHKVAYSYSKKSTVALEDLEQIGIIGLIAACEKFDPSRGYKFSTYAVPLVRGEILHYLRDKSTPIRAPRFETEAFAKVRRHSALEGISLEAARILGLATLNGIRLSTLCQFPVSLQRLTHLKIANSHCHQSLMTKTIATWKKV